MTSTQEKGPVLVTGGSGFIALELISQLLSKGYTVHTTVRSLQNHAKIQPLQDLRGKHGEDKLLLFEADLLQPGSFRPAMQGGCQTVYHVASPFRMAEKIKDGQTEMVDPALQGTRNVLQSVEETPTVTRVVLTSTTGAIAGDYADVLDKMDNQVMSEKYFDESSTVKHNPYHYSKVLAEKEAWKMCKAQESKPKQWDLVVLCVALVLGPTVNTATESGSLYLMDELLSGWMFYGVPELVFLPVDIRDVATAHINAGEVKQAHGRYIVGPAKTTTFLEISKQFKKLKGGSMWLPSHQIPSVVTRIVGPLFGLTQKWMSRNLGVHFTVDNSRGVKELGITYRPLEVTLKDHYASWETNKKQGKGKTA